MTKLIIATIRIVTDLLIVNDSFKKDFSKSITIILIGSPPTSNRERFKTWFDV